MYDLVGWSEPRKRFGDLSSGGIRIAHSKRAVSKETALFWWKRAGSNRGPPACEAGTLTSWATLPYQLYYVFYHRKWDLSNANLGMTWFLRRDLQKVSVNFPFSDTVFNAGAVYWKHRMHGERRKWAEMRRRSLPLCGFYRWLVIETIQTEVSFHGLLLEIS